MIDVTFKMNGTDYSTLLSTYKVTHEVETRESVTTIDGTEYVAVFRRPTVTFSLIPMTDSQINALYDILSNIQITVTYTDPNLGQDATAVMRLATSLETVFGLRSIDGNRYYKGNSIILRQRTVL